MNNNKLPYSLNNMAPLFRSEDSITCNEYEILHPIYLTVRRENFLHMGIGNPNNPLDFESIVNNVVVGANDVVPPFVTVIPTPVSQPISVSPCENPAKEVVGFASITACRVITGGVFSTILYRPALLQEFSSFSDEVGLDQIVDYFSSDSIMPPASAFDIDIDLKNGGDDHPEYIGFTHLQFILDDPTGDLNGPGIYVFTVVPEAKIKYATDPS